MISAVMIVCGAVLIGLAVYAVALRWRSGPMALLLAVLCLAFAYNAIIVGIGRFVGAGDTLTALSVPRFWIQAVLFPLIIVVAGDLTGRLGADAARARNVILGGWALIAMLVVLGVVSDAARLRLEPDTTADVVRYVNADDESTVLPLVITVLAVVVLGMMAWRYGHFPWLFAGGVVMLVCTALGDHVWTAGVGIVVLMVALTAAMVEVGNREAPAPPVSIDNPKEQ